jgi:large subunit ribosomal protein L29
MKAADLREMTSDELRDRETDLSQQLFNLRLQKVTGQLENPAKVGQTRRDLARVLTVLNERRGEPAGAAAAAEPAAAESA